MLRWALNPETDKKVPLSKPDAMPAKAVRYRIGIDGQTELAIRDADGPYLNHFQDCPKAGQFNRGSAPKPEARRAEETTNVKEDEGTSPWWAD